MRINNKVTRAARYLFGLVPAIKKKYAEVQKYDSILLNIPDKIFNGTVLDGPFTGISYKIKDAYYSAFYPKLIGSYEFELYPVMEDVINKSTYANIFDVGCADGYYAIGLAAKLAGKNTIIYAIDINQHALDLCKTLAEQNKLSNIKIENCFFDNAYFEKNILDRDQKNLVIMDCEGYEKDFFEGYQPALYRSTDFIIEVHDFLSLGLVNDIALQLEKTHMIEVIHSVDDLFRPYFFKRYRKSNAIDSLSYEQQFVIMREGRVKGMVWLIAKAR